MRCRKCRKETDHTRTAYFLDGSTLEDLCSECAAKLEQDDLDSTAEDAIEILCKAANRMGNTRKLADAILYGMRRQHRYLQNELFTALHFFFEKYGNLPEEQFDARNAWAVRAANNWQKHSFDS